MRSFLLLQSFVELILPLFHINSTLFELYESEIILNLKCRQYEAYPFMQQNTYSSFNIE